MKIVKLLEKRIVRFFALFIAFVIISTLIVLIFLGLFELIKKYGSWVYAVFMLIIMAVASFILSKRKF
jgi:hypothetical protein